MFKNLGKEAGRIGKQVERVVRDARNDLTAAVNETVLEVAVDQPLKEAGAREQNIQERMNDITPKLLLLNKRFQDLMANPAFPDEYDKETIKTVLGELAAKLITLTELQKQVLTTKGELTARSKDGSSSESAAKAAYDGIISKQKTAETNFMAIYNETLETVATMNAEADDIDAQMKEASDKSEKLAALIQDVAISKRSWDTLLSNQFFPANAPKAPILAKLDELEAGIDSLLDGNSEPSYEQVKSALDAGLKARAHLEKLTAKAQAEAIAASTAVAEDSDDDLEELAQRLMVTSRQGRQAVTGDGSLQTRVPSNNPFDDYDPAAHSNTGAPGLFGA